MYEDSKGKPPPAHWNTENTHRSRNKDPLEQDLSDPAVRVQIKRTAAKKLRIAFNRVVTAKGAKPMDVRRLGQTYLDFLESIKGEYDIPEPAEKEDPLSPAERAFLDSESAEVSKAAGLPDTN